MKRSFVLVALCALAACDTAAKKQLAFSDSARGDSLVRLKDEMLNEVMSSTQFVNDLNTEIAKLKTPLRAVSRSRAPNRSSSRRRRTGKR
jgi:hypothetical protein